MQKFENVVDVAERNCARSRNVRCAANANPLLGAERIEFVQLLVARQHARRLEMIDDRERDEHGPAPGRHFVNVKRRPGRQQNHFHRNRRQIFPGKLPEQREVKLAEGVHPRNAAEPQDGRARLLHERRVGRAAGELEREVGFDRRVDLARAAVINVPAAVRQLAFQNVADTAFLQLSIDFAAANA